MIVRDGKHRLFLKFKENDYDVIGSGKILHHNKNELWTEFEHQADYSPIAYQGEWERGKKGIAIQMFLNRIEQ